MNHLSKLQTIDNNQGWSLFLDRDGVINQRIPDDYVKNIHEMILLPGVCEALKTFAGIFSHIFVVTNQQGVGKGLMSHEQLQAIHHYMKSQIETSGGRIDAIYYAPYLKSDNHPMRKPNIGMGLQAKREFPNVDFKKSIMAGDSISDMQFGKRLGMTTIFISPDLNKCRDNHEIIDYRFDSLQEFAQETFRG